jgi:hypothetical protein
MESLHGRFALSFVPAGKSMGPKNMYTERRFEEQFFYRNRRSKAPTDLFYQKEIIKKVQSKTKGTKKRGKLYAIKPSFHV